MRVLRFGFVGVTLLSTAVGIVVACGPPSSFDNLVGGDAARDVNASATDGGPSDASDPSVDPPRPVAPLSATWINGTKPHFAWKLAPSTVGAVLLICDTRACSGVTHSYDAVSSFDLPDELTPGIWYWKLTSKTSGGTGTKTSPPWEFLVRGGGTSTHPNGSFVDLDGDGKPDLLATALFDTADGGVPPTTEAKVLPLIATGNDGTEFLRDFGGESVGGPLVDVANPALAVADTDGDGYGDIVVAAAGQNNGDPEIHAYTYFGGPQGLAANIVLQQVPIPALTAIPALREVPDFDADGWGDVVFGTETEVFAVFGSARGLSQLAYLFANGFFAPDSGQVYPAGGVRVIGGFDRNDDGFSDIAMDAIFPDASAYVFNGSDNRTPFFALSVWTATPVPPSPTRFASGDVDGDGKNDLAFATTVGGNLSICVLLATQAPAEPARCWAPSPQPTAANFASAMIGADLDADGKDEILVGSPSGGVDVIHYASDNLTATHITTAFGATMTTIYPGRPGPAVWAATRPDGSEIQIFKGSDPASSIKPNPIDTYAFGSSLR